MYSPDFKPQYYSFIVIAMVLWSVIACRDFEDCRSIYTNKILIKFTGKNQLSLEEIKFYKPIEQKLYSKGFEFAIEPGIKVLTGLKDRILPFHLHPNHDMVTLLLYRTQTDTNNPPPPDTLTIFYTRIASLISPKCGIQQEYIIDRVETSFAGSKIIKATLKDSKHEKPEDQNKPNIEIQY
jgi:hypothetical protein